MPISANDALAKRGTPSNLLKGSDLPKSQRTVTVKVTDVREAPDSFNSPVILDIEPVFERTAFPVNKSNTKRLSELIGDDLSELKGKKVTLEKILVNNPKENKMVWGLIVTSVKK